MHYDGRSALIIVDVQNDFGHPKGSLYVPGGEEVVPVANREIDRALAGGAMVAFSQDWHPPATPHFAKDGGAWPVHCVRDTWGAEFVAGLHVAGPVIRKGVGGEDGYSAFSVRDPASGTGSSTGLEEMLRARGVERVAVVGLATDYCVKETVLDAVRAGFTTTVLREGVRPVEVEPGDGDRALEEMARAGAQVAG